MGCDLYLVWGYACRGIGLDKALEWSEQAFGLNWASGAMTSTKAAFLYLAIGSAKL